MTAAGSERPSATKMVAGRSMAAGALAKRHREAVQAMFGDAVQLYTASAAEADNIVQAVGLCVKALRRGNQVIFCGNGGSAAQCAHLAGELSGRFYRDRDGLRAVTLSENTAAITAIANDYGYDRVFERQLAALGRKGDVLFALTTSGGSPNVLAAATYARTTGIATIGLTGERGRAFAERCDLAFVVPSRDTARIQEVHILIGHIICARIEAELFPEQS